MKDKFEKRHIEIADSLEIKQAQESLGKRDDPEAQRLLRFLNMPDLSRDKTSPLNELVNRILGIERFTDFDEIKVPEIVGAYESFDLFNFPKDHPARSKSDTYYVDDEKILRTHTTIMWRYWLMQSEVKEKIKAKESIGALSYGKVYRKDEIDRNHMNIFHQMDGWYLSPKEKEVITADDLKEVLTEIAQIIFGKEIKYRFNKDEFPYTDPSIEMEIEVDGRWVEVLGSGIVKPIVLKNFGVDPDIYNGWAFGFGLERLAIISMQLPDIRLLWSDDPRIKKQLRLGNTYVPVSKYPPITRDISFVVQKDFVPNNYFDLIRDLGGDLVEEVRLIDSYENAEKFGADKISYTYRIIYRSNDRTLLSEEVDKIQDEIYKQTAIQFNAELR
tara:strand:- start:21520 stop:22680 length:1161 start_codon:yes stop_codon:yes gene_type:complete